MNELDYDAMTLGNHDLDIGADALQNASGNARFPLLAANLRGIPLSNNLVKMFVVGGKLVRVCIIGFTTPEDNPFAGSSLNFTHSSTDDFVAELIANHHENQCEIQILLSHLGFKQDEMIANLVSSRDGNDRILDLIIGGHTHLLLGEGLSKAVHQYSNNQVTMEPFPTVRGNGIPLAHMVSFVYEFCHLNRWKFAQPLHFFLCRDQKLHIAA